MQQALWVVNDLPGGLPTYTEETLAIRVVLIAQDT
jgi:hypothetical protein